VTWLILISVIILWASSFIGIKLGLNSFSPEALALFRYLTASIFIFLIYLGTSAKKKPNLKQFMLLLGCGITGVTIYNLALNYAELSVSPAIASFVIGMMPVCSLIISVFVFKDKVKKRAWSCVAISVCGLFVILLADLYHSQNLHASLLGFLSLVIAVVGMAIYTNIQRVLLKEGFKPLEMTAWSIWLGTFCLLFFLPETIVQMAHASMEDILAVVYLGIFPAAIAYVGWGYAISKLPFTKVVTALYFSPVFVILMQWSILGEFPFWLTIVGGGISVFGALLLARQKM